MTIIIVYIVVITIRVLIRFVYKTEHMYYELILCNSIYYNPELESELIPLNIYMNSIIFVNYFNS